MADGKTEISLNSYDFAFLTGLLCGADCVQHELEEMRHELEEEMRREAKTFERFVGLKNRTHEIANMLWAAIMTIRDRDTRIGVMNEVRAGFDRIEASDSANKAKR